MILTPIAPGQLRRALAGFAAALENDEARHVFRRIARLRDATRAHRAAAARHQAVALRLARCFGMGLRPGSPKASCGWDGRAARTATEAYVLLHEIAHFQLASPRRRRAIDFGLGPGPETGNRRAAERATVLYDLAREREEAMASLLGILWESALGQPGLASFLDQNWLEGASARAARHFENTLVALRAAGFVGAAGRPTRRLRQQPDAGPQVRRSG